MNASEFRTECDRVVTHSVGNATDTFLESGGTLSEDQYCNVAVFGVMEVLDANALRMTPKQIHTCEVLTKRLAKVIYPHLTRVPRGWN